MSLDDDGGDFCEHCGATVLASKPADVPVLNLEPPMPLVPEPPVVSEPSVVPEPPTFVYERHIAPVAPQPPLADEPAIITETFVTPASPVDVPAEDAAEPLPAWREDAVADDAPACDTAPLDALDCPVFDKAVFAPREAETALAEAGGEEEEAGHAPEQYEYSSGTLFSVAHRGRVIGVAAALVLSLSSAVLLFRWYTSAPAITQPAQLSAAANTNAVAASASVIPEGMLSIPGGTFQMGRDGGDEYESPAHRVTVGPFYLDAHEVTNEQYAKFVAATGQPPPPVWVNGAYDASAARLPVTGVTWLDAHAYAQWAGKRLPTEEEWEFAARGTDGRLYPWGNTWQPNAANAASDTAEKMVAVGSYPNGASPFGALDMVGNAWEWTSSNPVPYPGSKLPGNLTTNSKVIRGNFWGSKAEQATATYRGFWAANGAATYKNTGFRCAKDAVGVAPSR
jgi:serine/threonine-protein kinase